MNRTPIGVTAETLARFRKALAAAEHADSPLPETVKGAVCSIVDEMKAAGQKPEQVVIAVRGICLDAGLASAQYGSGQRDRDIYGVVAKIISACIERYYQPPEDPKLKPNLPKL